MHIAIYSTFVLKKMQKKFIQSRDEVSLLVRTFYDKVRKDELLGPVFNGIIPDWEIHLELLTDFWETQLLYKRKYYGNPMMAHVEVDRMVNNTVTEMHFGVWINLWINTLDDLFDANDEVAAIAKNRARHMGTFLYVNLFKARQIEAE